MVEHSSSIDTLNVTSEDILKYVSLQELEQFENSQFEKELVFEDALLVKPKKKAQGRPPKAALVRVGLSSDDSDSESDVVDDGIAVVIPSINPRKRARSPASARGPGRPRKFVLAKPPAVSASPDRLPRRSDHEHVSLPQVKKRTPRAKVPQPSRVRYSPLFLSDSHHEDDDELMDAASSQLFNDGEDYENQKSNVRQGSLLAPSNGKYELETSSLLETTAPSVDLEDEGVARTSGPSRPSKLSTPTSKTEDSRLETADTQVQARKAGRPRKDPRSKTHPNDKSDTEDELASLHQRFRASPRSGVKSSEKNDQLSKSNLRDSSNSHENSDSKIGSSKSGPSTRAGYRLPTLSKTAPSTSDDDDTSDAESSASSHPPEQQPLPPTLQKAMSSVPIIISSDESSDESSDSLVAASSHMTSGSVRTPRPIDRSKQIAVPGIKAKPMLMTGNEVSKSANSRKRESVSEEAETSESGEGEDDDEDILGSDFPIVDVPSSQSYVAHPSTASDTDGRERRIRQDEIAKTRRAAGPPSTSNRRLQSIRSGQSMDAQNMDRGGMGSHPVRGHQSTRASAVKPPPRSKPPGSLPLPSKFSIPIGLRPPPSIQRQKPLSSSSGDSTSSDDSAMIATIKKNPSLFDRGPTLSQKTGAPRRQASSKASTAAKKSNLRPFLPSTKSKTQFKPQAANRRPSNSPPISIPIGNPQSHFPRPHNDA